MNRRLASLALVLASTTAPLAAAEPSFFGNWIHFDGPPAAHGYYAAEHHPDLNPKNGITIELVIYAESLPYTSGCRGLVGKGYLTAYWVGICGDELRSYTRGLGSEKTGGTLTDRAYHHIAVTSDGFNRTHYIDGVEVANFPDAGLPTLNTEPVHIGSDPHFLLNPTDTSIDEVRIWNYERSAAEIAAGVGKPKTLGEPGLVAVWNFDNYGLLDVVGGHNLEPEGDESSTSHVSLRVPEGPWITASTLPDFEVKVRIKNGAGTLFAGSKVTPCPEDTICLSGQVEDRPEIFVRVVGPKPNGYLWAILTKFTVFQVEVWIRKTGDEGEATFRYYFLAAADSSTDDSLPGLTHRTAFLP